MPGGRKLIDDCFLTDRDRLTHDAALAILRERARPVVGIEEVVLERAFGRILGDDAAAPRDVPNADNAAVDGYAFAHADYVAASGRLRVADRIVAGRPSETALRPGEAARIFTGAVMPAGADTVAMQEDCSVEAGGAAVHIPPGLKPGANRRRAGEDVRAGSVAIKAGARLRPQEIAALASFGCDRVRVFERLKVAIVSSGEEIVRPGAGLAPGQVYDSNRYLLGALLETVGAEMRDEGVLPDRAERVRAALADLSVRHHAILTTGGASRGEEDHLAAALGAVGRRHLWQIAVKPGRPMAFGQVGDTVVLGLPGNPVAVMVCFLLYARPLLVALGGGGFPEPPRYPLPAAFAIRRKKKDRREFLRGILRRESGRLVLDKFPRDGSGLITGLREADGLVELDEATVSVAPGDLVSFIPFPEFGLPPR